MKADCSAVAGFFEDLPVLALVLAGAMTVVLSSVWVSEAKDSQRQEEELAQAAERVLEHVVMDLVGPDSMEGMPLLSKVRSVNLSDLAVLADPYDSCLSIALIHPSRTIVICETTDPEGSPSATGFASRLLNSLDESGLVVILEVRAIVW